MPFGPNQNFRLVDVRDDQSHSSMAIFLNRIPDVPINLATPQVSPVGPWLPDRAFQQFPNSCRLPGKIGKSVMWAWAFDLEADGSTSPRVENSSVSEPPRAWIQLPLRSCREARSPEPNISLKETRLWITFPFASEGSVEVTWGKKPAKTRVKILRMIQENPAVSARQLAGALGITQKGVEWHLRHLQAGGELRREGPAKGGRWLVSP